MNDLSDSQLSLIDTLLKKREPISLSSLSQHFDGDTQQLHESLAHLEELGCKLQWQTQARSATVSLERTGLSTWSDYVKWSLHDPNRLVEVYQQINSTQDGIRRLLAAHGDTGDGAIVTADEQQTGRGRLGRPWLAPPGDALLFSRAVVSSRTNTAGLIDRLTSCSAVAVALAIESVANLKDNVSIKWPNDIMLDGHKLAGILVETISTQNNIAAVIGIGVNVHQSADTLRSLPKKATSLHMAGQAIDRLLLLVQINQQLDKLLNANEQTILDQWRIRSSMLGQTIQVQQGGQTHVGSVVDLDITEGLVLRTQLGSLVHLPAETSTIV